MWEKGNSVKIMDNYQIADAKNTLSGIEDCINHINDSHEKLTFEYERTIRHNINLMEMDCFSKEDKYFFDEQNQQIRNFREQEEEDYAEYSKRLNKHKEQLEQEIAKAEKENALREEKEREEKERMEAAGKEGTEEEAK